MEEVKKVEEVEMAEEVQEVQGSTGRCREVQGGADLVSFSQRWSISSCQPSGGVSCQALK